MSLRHARIIPPHYILVHADWVGFYLYLLGILSCVPCTVDESY